MKKYQGIRKFAWNWFNRISHDYLNTVGLADGDVENFLVRIQPCLNRSIIVVFADHGNRYDSIRETVSYLYPLHLLTTPSPDPIHLALYPTTHYHFTIYPLP
jgi:hypothetical protein